jgi:cell wall-associated NlpC family hydrolase
MQQKKRNYTPSFRAALILALALVISAGCARRNIPAGSPGKISTGSMVAQTATTQIGKPYRSGGSSPQTGFDCSGLVYWAYGQHGIQIPRATTGQVKTGKSISRPKLAPGDIVVFRERSGPNQLHTGIYVGNNNFIHSPNSRSSVRIDSLNASHWRRVFVSGRRIV